ncbi:hypothetical protein BpHYR1_015203, partial [Brachionus plicatilis]
YLVLSNLSFGHFSKHVWILIRSIQKPRLARLSFVLLFSFVLVLYLFISPYYFLSFVIPSIKTITLLSILSFYNLLKMDYLTNNEIQDLMIIWLTNFTLQNKEKWNRMRRENEFL